MSHDYLEARMEIRGDQLSISAGYCLLFSMHSYIHVLLDGVKTLHVLLNLIQGGKHLLPSIMWKAL